MKKILLIPKAWIPTLFVIFFSFSLNITITVTPLRAQFAGGDGSSGNPYQIANVNQLQLMKDYLSSHFILINNIDASVTSGWNGGQGFEPVGFEYPYFTGSLNGNGKVITGLTIDRPSLSAVGLLGYTKTNLNDTVIKNLGLENAAIKGGDAVGALVGYNDGGSIINSYSTGSVSGNNFAGGLVGFNHGGAISNSYSAGSISGEITVGGLVGQNTASINGSYSTGSVHGNNYVGGLVGSDFGSITSSYSTGNASGKIGIGGLAGRSDRGEIINCYSTGSANGDGGIGGFIGVNSGSITSSYSTGSVSGSYSVGGFAGSNTGIITHSYWNITTSGQPDSTGGTGLPDSQFRKQASFTGFDFIQNWNIMENHSYPFLRSNPQNPPAGYLYPFAGGDGSANNPFIIENIDQLQAMKNFLSSHFILNNNIDASATAGWNSGAGFEPVGTGVNQFKGSLNGNSKVITGLTIDRPSLGAVGLFGYAQTNLNDTVIKNLGLENADIKGGDSVGALIGYNNGGSIINSHAAGSVNGNNFAGGLVGLNHNGSIIRSYATGSVHTNICDAGGLVANNSGSITDSYATGSVSGNCGVGGLAGTSDYGTITNSHSAGNVSGNSYVGGLVADNHGGTVTNSYSTGNVSGDSYVGGLSSSNSGTITNSYATGSVSGTDNVIGGLVGKNEWNGIISNCYATGNVSGNVIIGGLVGEQDNFSTIINSYAIGNVSGDNDVGGLVGLNNETITNGYAAGSVSGNINTGGLVGWNNSSKITNCYWNITTTGKSNGIGGGSSAETTGLGDSVFRNQVSFGNFDFATVWNIMEGLSYPFLRNNPQNPLPGLLFAGGDGSLGNPYQIASITQLQLMKDLLSSHFILIKNIDASVSADWNGGAGFEPVGTESTHFTGSLNGNGKVITGLYINRPEQNYIGLFGYININANDTAIKDLGLEDISISGNQYVGGLIGTNDGTISNCYAAGSISGNSSIVGGLVGYNTGTITTVYAAGSVTGSNFAGGLVGINSQNGGTITNSYATNSVSGTDNEIGGLVGMNFGGTITNSYATGSVSGTWSIGGLVGRNSGGTGASWGTIANSYTTGKVSGRYYYIGGLVGENSDSRSVITNSYATGSVSGNNITGGLAGHNVGTITGSYWNITTTNQQTSSGGTGLPDSEFRQAAKFVNWDFTGTGNWDIEENVSYPFLRSNPQDPPPGSHPMVGSHLPTVYALSQNYPNPFNPVTRINYEIPVEGLTKIMIYDMSGREITTLVNEVLTPGYYTVDFNGAGLASGVYFYRLIAGNSVASKKMVLVK